MRNFGTRLVRCRGARGLALAGLVAVTTPAAVAGAAQAAGGAAQAAGAPFTVDDLVRLERITDPQLSPDGRQLAFVQRQTDMDANKGRTSLWLLDLAPRRAAPPDRRQGERLESALVP